MAEPRTNEELIGDELALTARKGGLLGGLIGGGIFGALGGSLGGPSSARAVGRGLELDRHDVVLDLPTEPEEALRAVGYALERLGRVEEPAPGGPPVRGMVKAGGMNQNPAIVEADVAAVDGNARLTITACAREGRVKQHTARKATERVVEALGLPSGLSA